MEFATSAEFARHIRSAVEGYLKPGARVTFRGSFAGDQHDEYSDVDLHAGVFGRELDAAFFSDLESFLTDLYGPALVRYDPDNADTTDYQHVRFSFYWLQIFWRLDLDISSDRKTVEKHPANLTEWQTGTPALMNVVWAVKYHHRRDDKAADHYLHSACEKLGCEKLGFSVRSIEQILSLLERRGDIDLTLLSKVRAEAVSGCS